MKQQILVVLGLLGLLFAGGISGSRVFRVQVRSEEQVKRVSSFLEENLVDVWAEPRDLENGFFDLHLPIHLEPQLGRLSLPFTIMIENVEEMIEEERIRMMKNKNAEFFEEYQTLDSIYNWLGELASSYPSLVKTFVLGKTYEGRDIMGVKISSGRASKEFFFNGGIHSREWVSPAATLYMVNEMVTKYGRDSNVTAMIDGLDWAVVPVLNPDGYLYTFSNDRLWRKNREPNPSSACAGTDLNRNYPYKWNTGGSSNLPCSDAYHGPSAASAPETKAILEYLNTNKGRLAGYIDVHAYSQLIMYPYGFSTSPAPDSAFLQRVGENSAAALQAVYGTRYQVGSIANIIYVASGSSVDYTYSELGIRCSFAYELRDTGRYGFLLPPAQIIPTGIETFESLKVIALQGALGY